MCLGSLPCWKDQATTHLQSSYWGKEVVGQNLVIHGPIHPPLNTVQSSCPLCRKAPSKHDVSTPMLYGRDGVLGIVLILLLLQTRRVEFIPKSYILVSSDHMNFSHPSSGSHRWSLANYRRARTCAGLSRGTLCTLQDFNPWRCSVLLMVTVETVVPALFRSLTRSSRVVLGWSLTFLRIIDTPWGEILHGAPVRGRLTVILNFLYFLIIAPTVVAFSPSCFAYCHVAHPSLVQVYNFVLRQLFGLAHSREVWLIVWTGVFYTGNEFKQVQLIQVFRCAVVHVEREDRWGENAALRISSADRTGAGMRISQPHYLLPVC